MLSRDVRFPGNVFFSVSYAEIKPVKNRYMTSLRWGVLSAIEALWQ